MQATKKKSRLKNGWNLTHLTQHPCNLLIESDLRLRQVAVGRWCKVTHQAHRYRDGGGDAPPQATPALPRLFVERRPPAGEGGFLRAKCADTRGPVCPIPPLGTPTPTDWPPKGTGLPLPTGHLRPLTD